MRALSALAALLLVAGCGDPAPRARAERLGTLDDAIGGPHAIGRVGDFLLENDQIRLVIADTGVDPRDPSKTTLGRVNTTFGGTLVDADLRRVGGARARGNDQLAELLPGFVFSVINPTSVAVTKTGDDGQAAEVTVTGTPSDLLQMVYLLNVGLVGTAALELTQTYRLAPGKRYVEILTTIKNTSTGAHPFPFLDPTELKDLGFNIPGIDTIQLSVPMGQLPLLGGEQQLFAPGVAGFNVRFAIEDSYALAGGFPAFPGLAIDYLASRGPGVSYGLTVPASDDNYVNAYAEGYAGQRITPHSMLVPFTYAGVAGVYMARPPAQLAPQEQFTYRSYFIVGKGDVASVADTIYELHGEVTGTFGGRVIDAQTSAPIAGASVLVLDAQDHVIDQIETDAGGSFLAKLPVGAYRYTVLVDDRLPTAPVALTVTAGGHAGVAPIEIAAPATLVVSVIDELGRHAPAKVQLLGRFPAAQQGKDPRSFLYSLERGERVRPTAFDGSDRFIEGAWWTADGRLSATVRPGTYELIVSRGPEYEVTQKTIELRAGAFTAEQLALTRAFTSEGWVAGDFHIHAQPSTDSGLPIAERVASCAAEGLEVAIATDHNYITDYAPVIAATGLDSWLLGIPGMELTTFEMGHFNGYPLRVDPGSTRGGEFRWAGLPPQALFDQLRALAIDPARAIVQVNHPRQQVLGYFAQFFVDELTAQPYTPTGILGIFAAYGDEFNAENFSTDFDAIELVTGKQVEDNHTFRAPDPLPAGPFPDPQPVPGEIVRGPDGRALFPGVIETWFTMLDHGKVATGMGTSDSHQLIGDEPGYARTMLYVGAGKDVPGGYSRDDVIEAVRQHRAVTTNAPLVEVAVGDGRIGDTVVVQGGNAQVAIHVRAPSWAKVDRLVVYANSAIVADQVIPASEGTDYQTTIRLSLARDSWIVAEATGTGNMFPVLTPTEFPPLDATVVIQALSIGLDLSSLPLTSKLRPSAVHTSTPFAITNPIWVDIDGNGWNAPKPPLPKRPAAAARPDVRALFDALPEVSP
ncbi:MAG: carboxypeptidase regulatory-like domain-containing protein [Myxococcales bacterium]|nr:carboxypeptidase regulatory-like domain-containing protein [Myxococcales bacterium]